MTIIANNGNSDLTIQFEDGIIVKNKTYWDFKKGNIGHPYLKYDQKTKKYKYIN